MRIKLPSGKVYERTPEEMLRWLHQTSAYRNETYGAYLEGFVERLQPQKVWLEPPDSVRRSDDEFARWLGGEMLRVKRWFETTDPTEEEKEVKAKAAAEARAKAAAEAKAKAAAEGTAAPKPGGAPAAAGSPQPAAAKPAAPTGGGEGG